MNYRANECRTKFWIVYETGSYVYFTVSGKAITCYDYQTSSHF